MAPPSGPKRETPETAQILRSASSVTSNNSFNNLVGTGSNKLVGLCSGIMQ